MSQPLTELTEPVPKFKIYHTSTEDFAHHQPASFQDRAMAVILDGFFFTLLTKPVQLLLRPFYEYVSQENLAVTYVTAFLVSTLLIIYYYIWPTAEWGQTIGKRLLDIKVVSTGRQSQISFWQSLGRGTIGLALSFGLFGYGFLRVRFRKDGLALHDTLFQTKVISLKR